jgi:putative nucleotidyltransferase with HDIG domain
MLQEAFWRHSLAVAHAAEIIGRHALAKKPDADPEAVFLAGLMHDIGVLVLASHYPKQYAAVSAYAGERGVPLPEAEVAVLDLDHGEIGACLVEHWQFPADTAAAIRFHHRVERAPEEYRWAAAVIRLADAASSMDPSWDLGEGSSLSEAGPWLEDLGIKEEALPEILEETRVEATRATAVLAEAR